MNKSFLSFFSVLMIFLGLLSSCRSTVPVAQPMVTVDTLAKAQQEVKAVYDQFKAKEFSAPWLLGKFDGVYHDGDKTQGFNGQIRIQKDSVIWANINALMGIEIFRILIRPDSFFMLNKLEKTYTAESSKYLNEKFGMQIHFEMLQAVLLGNDFPYYETDVFKLSENAESYQLSTLGRRKLKKYVKANDDLNKVMVQTLNIDKSTFRLKKQNAKIIGQDKAKLRAVYDKYIEVGGQLFPSFITLFLKDDDKTYLEIQFSSVESGQKQSFPFKIPAKYTKVSIN